MPTIATLLDSKFRQAIRVAFDLDADPLVGPSQNEKFGDYQANAAMGLAKTLSEKTGQKANPRQIAEQIKAKLDLGDIATELSIAGPGFINVRLNPLWLASLLQQAGASQTLAIEPTPIPQTVVVDYSGPNIAKEMHVGHLRSTIIGDAVARVLAFRGDNVIRQNHFGDWGTQFGRVVLAMWYQAGFRRSGNGSALTELIHQQQTIARQAAADLQVASGDAAKEKAAKENAAAALAGLVNQTAEWHQRLLDQDPDGTRHFEPYLRDDALALDELEAAYVFVSVVTDHARAKQITITRAGAEPRTLEELPRLITTFIQNPDDPANRQERLAWEKARAVTLDACNAIYRRLHVQLVEPELQTEPLERPESFYNPLLPAVVTDLRARNLAITSDGATVVRVPGFETPLIVEKAGGGFLYGTTDLAAIRFRTGTLGASRVVYFVDARQSQHFTQVFWTAREAGWATDAALEHAAFGTMLGADGKPFKTRSGDTVKLRDLLDEAEERALAVVSEKNTDLSADQKAAIAHAVGIGAVKYADLSKDRTSDYVFSFDKMLSLEGNTAPYLLYAHARIRSIFRKAAAAGATPGPIKLESPYELALAKHVLRFGDVIALVARELKPHHLTTYLYDLAGAFSSFYENCPVLQSDEATRASRLALADTVARTIAQGLDLLGIEHPEQM
ncbi:MAG TPA: arginine--tRNA ligase [Tepidisphaeraceae bacterium]|nr:arginine--tRNA ligase [Tepidisphaeraceae bacterium]